MNDTTRTHNLPDIDAALADARQRYVDSRPKSLETFEAAAEVMPGGNTRTVLFHGPYPFRAAGGEGAWLTDVDGHRVLNLLGEYTAGLLGHDHPVIRAAVTEALEGGINMGAHNTYEPEFARLVCERFPAVEKVRFTNSGTEGNLMATTTARAFTGRDKVMVFQGGYHGGVLMFKPGIATNVPFPWIIGPYIDAEGAARLIRENAGDLAAVLVEPMQGAGGCIAAEPGFLETLREETEKAGAFLIFDEVMVSRLGPHCAHGLLGITPDLISLGKWVGGGMSFGGFGGPADAMDLYDPRRPDAMRERLNGICREAGANLSFTGTGTLMNVHPTTRPIRCLADTNGMDERLRELLFLDLLDVGYYTAPRGFLALSLAVSDDDLDGFAATLEQIVRERLPLFK